MKKLLFVIFISFLPSIGYSQDYGNNSDALELCSYIQLNNFGIDLVAEDALDKILSTIGASKRFVLKPCDNINNAVATSYKGIRYILYDRDFMSSINNGNSWGNLFILAHEVGHHINGHTLDWVLYAAEVVEPKTLGQIRQQELEADEFAGFVLAKLGGPISEANRAISGISSNKDDSYSTHPNKTKRIAAIKKGYNKASGSKPSAYMGDAKTQTAEECFYRAYDKARLKDHHGAIADYTKVIELDHTTKAMAYYNRGASKLHLKDYYGAIADYTKVIELDPDFSKAYFNRGFTKVKLDDYYGAIADFTKTIGLDPNSIKSYYNRCAIKYFFLGDSNGACSDCRKAASLGHSNAGAFVKKYCN